MMPEFPVADILPDMEPVRRTVLPARGARRSSATDAAALLADEIAKPTAAAGSDGVPVERRSIAEQVAHRILSLVKSGNLKSGDRLPTEQQMARALGISRPALREALKALTVLGVIESRQGGRYTVTDLSPVRLMAPLQFMVLVRDYDVQSHFEARAAVDLELVRLCCARATDRERARIVQLAGEGQAFRDDPVGFRVLDFAFHQTINEAAANTLLQTISHGLYDLILEASRLATETPGVLAISAADHVRIARHIAANQPEAAVEAYRVHLEHIRAAAEGALARVTPHG